MRTKYIILITLFVIYSQNIFAHFGSKGPYGGSVSCSIVHDTTVYLGTYNGGVYESTNSKLQTWRARPVGLKSGKITSLTHTWKYLFAGTADSGVFVFNGFSGSDKYWRKVNQGLTNLSITCLWTMDSITVLAGTDGGGIYISYNKGGNWSALNASLTNFKIKSFANAGNRIFHTSDAGIFASDNSGANWFDFNNVNTNNIITYNSSFNTYSDEVLIFNNTGLYVASNASTTHQPNFASANAGLPANTHIRSISNDGSNWYLATDKGVYTSAVGSINWVSSNPNLTSFDINTVHPFQNRLIAGSNYAGIFKADKINTSWTNINIGFNNVKTHSFVCSGSNNIIAATEFGVFVSNDVASTYAPANKGLTDSLNVNDIIFHHSKLLAATKYEGVFLSEDTGKTWFPFNNGLGSLNIVKIFSNGNLLYLFNSDGHLYSYNGISWQMDHHGIPSASMPTDLTFYNNRVYISLKNKGVYCKPFNSGMWMDISTGLINKDVTSLTAMGDKLYAGTNGSGIFVSDTSTVSWTQTASTTIPHATMIGLNASKIQTMGSYAGYVFASYKGGLLASSDKGQSWIPAGNQFNLPSYTDVNKISFVTSRVFVQTENNSLYSNALSELPVVSGISEYNKNISETVSIYPNPGKGMFALDLRNLNANVKSVHIYNALGVKIDTIEIGNNVSIVCMDADYKSGVYFIQIVSNKGNITKMLVIE